MDILEIKQMNAVERLRIMEAVWDSLLYDESEIESPEWRKIEKGEAKFVSVKDLRANRP